MVAVVTAACLLIPLAPSGAAHLTDSAGTDTLDFSGADYGVTVSLGFDAGQTQVLDTAGSRVYELYVAPDRTLRLWSPPGGLSSGSINQSTGQVVP